METNQAEMSSHKVTRPHTGQGTERTRGKAPATAPMVRAWARKQETSRNGSGLEITAPANMQME